jgi:hypothetical protein
MGGACVGTEVRQGRIAGIVVLLALAANPRAELDAGEAANPGAGVRAGTGVQRPACVRRAAAEVAGPEPTPIAALAVMQFAITSQPPCPLPGSAWRCTQVSAVGPSTAPPSRVGCITWSLRGRDTTRPGRSYWLPITTPPSAALAASDDKSSVAAMLETARAIASGEPLSNDIVMIFTDGEEAGLLGASSFVAEHPGGAQGGVVLNWEATGNAGPSVSFETSSEMRN